MDARAHVLVSGLVQGIGFRKWTRWLAGKLSVTGWVRNTDDKVEILVEGPDSVIEDFIKRLWRGPIGSRVETVDVKKENYKGEFSIFEIKYE